jgi:hypothetical protein
MSRKASCDMSVFMRLTRASTHWRLLIVSLPPSRFEMMWSMFALTVGTNCIPVYAHLNACFSRSSFRAIQLWMLPVAQEDCALYQCSSHRVPKTAILSQSLHNPAACLFFRLASVRSVALVAQELHCVLSGLSMALPQDGQNPDAMRFSLYRLCMICILNIRSQRQQVSALGGTPIPPRTEVRGFSAGIVTFGAFE